jgi:hypothetical protein
MTSESLGSLGRLDQLAPEDPEVGRGKFNVMQDALNAVHSMGITFLRDIPPDYTIPASITSLTDRELGELLTAVGKYCGFVEEQLPVLKGDMEASKSYSDFIQASVRIALKSNLSEGKLTNPERDDRTLVNPAVIDAQNAVLFKEAKWSIAKAIHGRCQRDWDTVSRRITQRGQDLDRSRREVSVDKVPGHSGNHFGGQGFRRS